MTIYLIYKIFFLIIWFKKKFLFYIYQKAIFIIIFSILLFISCGHDFKRYAWCATITKRFFVHQYNILRTFFLLFNQQCFFLARKFQLTLLATTITIFFQVLLSHNLYFKKQLNSLLYLCIYTFFF